MQTEAINPNTADLDKLSSQEFVDLYIEEDQAVWRALKQAKSEISAAIDLIYELFAGQDYPPYDPQNPTVYKGPKLFYTGAGTSGRMGILDAVECLPTFSVHPDMIQGFIAGGDSAIRRAVEGAEDSREAGVKFVEENLSADDVLIGIAASGSTPYVIAALEAAQKLGAKTIAIANNAEAKTFAHCDQRIFLNTGPEILSGSTRLKAGTSQKICLNMLSTGLMVKLGKVMGNLMVDLQATNKKLLKRAKNLVMQVTNCSEQEALQALEENNNRVKAAITSIDS